MNRAGGNPLFLEELTYALLESGYIKRGEKGYELSGKVGEIQVPDTIQGIIAARLDRLEENLRRTVQVASVIGRKFPLSLLEAVVGAKEEVKTHLLDSRIWSSSMKQSSSLKGIRIQTRPRTRGGLS